MCSNAPIRWGELWYWLCGRNPIMLPFIWKLIELKFPMILSIYCSVQFSWNLWVCWRSKTLKCDHSKECYPAVFSCGWFYVWVWRWTAQHYTVVLFVFSKDHRNFKVVVRQLSSKGESFREFWDFNASTQSLLTHLAGLWHCLCWTQPEQLKNTKFLQRWRF